VREWASGEIFLSQQPPACPPPRPVPNGAVSVRPDAATRPEAWRDRVQQLRIDDQLVKVTNTGGPSHPYDSLSFVSRDRDPMATEYAGAEPHDRHSERSAPQAARLEARHPNPYRPLSNGIISDYNQPL
jgi:hypothetical protein